MSAILPSEVPDEFREKPKGPKRLCSGLRYDLKRCILDSDCCKIVSNLVVSLKLLCEEKCQLSTIIIVPIFHKY